MIIDNTQKSSQINIIKKKQQGPHTLQKKASWQKSIENHENLQNSHKKSCYHSTFLTTTCLIDCDIYDLPRRVT